MSDVVIVGGGIAGLTAAAYLSLEGLDPLILEKESKIGGLINSFERDGFVYDGGIRATENSGILFPMLKQLGSDLEFVKNDVSLGLEDQVIRINSEDDIHEYQEMLNRFYPDNQKEIQDIFDQIKKIMNYMDIQYGIDNPSFIDMTKNLGYVITNILPWMVKYAFTFPKINKLNTPVEQFLEKYTENRALIDIITQHFFKQTPTYFALSYLKIYLDYHYPIGGTGAFPTNLASFIKENGGTIKTDTKVISVNPAQRYLEDSEGNRYEYSQLIWAADLNSLYKYLNINSFPDQKTRQKITTRKNELRDKKGNDSVITLYLGVNQDPSYFSEKNSAHFFYTPSKNGESIAGLIPLDSDEQQIMKWVTDISKLSTYEISIPVLRDPTLAPPGKTGLIISILFDYRLTKRIKEQGWYEKFRERWTNLVVDALDESIYPGLKDSIIHSFTVTPLSLEERTGNTQGAITGWAYSNNPIPAESQIQKIFRSTETPIPGISKAGHWTYSPSGMPISVLTGKLASDRVIKNLKKRTTSSVFCGTG